MRSFALPFEYRRENRSGISYTLVDEDFAYK